MINNFSYFVLLCISVLFVQTGRTQENLSTPNTEISTAPAQNTPAVSSRIDDGFPVVNMKITEIQGTSESLSAMKEKLKKEIEVNTKAYFLTLEKERKIMYDPVLVNEAAVEFYKTIQNINQVSELATRYNAAFFRGYLIRRSSLHMQKSFSYKIQGLEDALAALTAKEQVSSDKFKQLEKDIKDINAKGPFVNAPKSLYEYMGIASLLCSFAALVLVYGKT